MNSKNFIKKLILFLLPLAALFMFLELKVRKIPTSYEAKRVFFEKSLDSIEVLALGNSHMLHGINPEYFSIKGFNLASGFQNYFYDKELTLKYLDRLKKLKVVFISADYISFYYRIKDVADWIDYGYYQAWGIHYPGLNRRDSRNYSSFMLYTPTNSLKYILSGDKKGMSKNVKPDGFNPEDSAGYKERISDSSGLFRARYHTNIINYSREAENTEHLEKLILALKKKGVEVVLINAPVFSTYSKFLDTGIIHHTSNIVHRFVTKFNCRYKDYSMDQRFSITDYHDNDHLNYTGAAKFTKVLDSEFVVPLLATEHTNDLGHKK